MGPDNKFEIKESRYLLLVSAVILIIVAFTLPTTIVDFFFPGSQPGESGILESPDKCQICHGGYDIEVEPTFNWTGSMMAMAARDPLYEACMTISNQDVAFSGDLCIRCHAPEGWLGGRSTPTDGSLLTDADKQGVHCDFCHRMVKSSPIGVNPFPADLFYTNNTYSFDQQYLSTISLLPTTPGNGSFIIDSDNTKRGPFSDAGAKHKFYYSPYHKESALCGNCHDVSNPAYNRNPDETYSANAFDQPSPSFNTYDMFPIERTYSEWLMSSYNTPEGVFAPAFGGNKQFVSTCQDCHMKDISGAAANKASAVYRNDLPHHDMTGGNTFVPLLVKAINSGSVNSAAIDSGISRARYMLRNAASMETSVDIYGGNPVVKVRITNETGHKLPSGYPEGRRIWINLIARDISGSVIYESGHYDNSTGILEKDNDIKVYEVKPGMDETIASLTGFISGPGFHFVLNNKIFSDNRIPPRGFTNANFKAIQSLPVAYSYEDGQYWDETEYSLPEEAVSAEAVLYYQAVSKEYIEFLKSENTTNNKGDLLYTLWSDHGKSPPEVMARSSVNFSPTEFVNYPESGDVSLFPNPSNDWITFRFPPDRDHRNLYLSVTDLSGSFKIRSRVINAEDDQLRIYVGNLTSGQYIYMIENMSKKVLYKGKFIIR